MGKISSLPDAERMAIIGYLAQEGVIREITAEVPLRRCNEFQSKYGVKPYVIRSDKKYSDQLRIYLSDPEDAPPLLKAALDTKYQRLNDSEFVRELVDNYGFIFFGKQDSRLITEKVQTLPAAAYGAFLDGYNTNNDFIASLRNAVDTPNLPLPEVIPVPDAESESEGKKRGRKKAMITDSNSTLTDEQLLNLGWNGEEYLYKFLLTGTEAAFSPFSIDVRKVTDVVWYNQGFSTTEGWQDGSVGKGCDILVKTTESDALIEVKSSKRRSPIFGMTSFEMQTMQEKRGQYYLAKIDYLEKLIVGQAPSLRVYRDPYLRFFRPEKMQKAVFFCEV